MREISTDTFARMETHLTVGCEAVRVTQRCQTDAVNDAITRHIAEEDREFVGTYIVHINHLDHGTANGLRSSV